MATVVMVVALVATAVLQAYDAPDEGERKVSVVASFYPLAYFAGEIGGEHVTVRTLVPPNSELHAWQPTPSDIVAADDADILLYNGAGLDHWFEDDVLGAIDTDGTIVVETTEGMELLGHGHDHNESDDHEHGDIDPHTWLSPHSALHQARMVYEALVEKDVDNAEDYSESWNGLRQRLADLDARYLEGLNGTDHDEIIVVHEAYGYLAHRYGFEQHGVIGLSADEQPSAPAIADLADLMVDHGIYAVFVDPVYSDDYAQTLKREVEDQTGETVTLLALYFMAGEMDGLDYLGQMERNLEHLKTGLGA